METLKTYIEKNGLKQSFIADQIGITRQHLSKVVNGEIPSRKLAQKIEEYTGGEVSAVNLVFPQYTNET